MKTRKRRRKKELLKLIPLDERILAIRGYRVILDTDLAEVYGVSTKALNQAVKRNREKFPADFIFQLSAQELREFRHTIDSLNMGTNRSQIVTGSQKHRDPRYRPYAFTEHGALMAATLLNSPRAVQMSVFVVRAFVKMRAALGDTRELARTLAALERELTTRLDIHEAAIVDVLQRIMRLLDPPQTPPDPPKEMGFHVRENTLPYRVRRKANQTPITT